jgi:hypothetical protein
MTTIIARKSAGTIPFFKLSASRRQAEYRAGARRGEVDKGAGNLETE